MSEAELPASLMRLIEAWQKEGATGDEIVERLDELELLATDERDRLIALVRTAA